MDIAAFQEVLIPSVRPSNVLGTYYLIDIQNMKLKFWEVTLLKSM